MASESAKLDELEAEIRGMLRDWETGRATSPDTRDYVLGAVEIYLPNAWPPEEVIDRVAQRVWDKDLENPTEHLRDLVVLVRDELLLAIQHG